MKSFLNSILLPLTHIALAVALLSGCHTVQGFGQDLQQGGAALQQAANENH